MANQTFKVAGITAHGSDPKVRFTDDMVRRIKQFTKGGATRCDFVELPSEMTKIESLKYLAAHPDFQSPSDQATIADSLADKSKEANKGTKTPAVPKKAAKLSLDAIKARGKKKEVTPEQLLAQLEINS